MTEENKNNEQNSPEDSKEQKVIEIEVHVGKIPTGEFPYEALLPIILKDILGRKIGKDFPQNDISEIIKDDYVTKNGLKVNGNVTSLGTNIAELFNQDLRCLEIGSLKVDYHLKDKCLTFVGSECLELNQKDFQDFIEWSHQYAAKNNLTIKYFSELEISLTNFLIEEYSYQFETTGRKCLVKSFQENQAA